MVRIPVRVGGSQGEFPCILTIHSHKPPALNARISDSSGLFTPHSPSSTFLFLTNTWTLVLEAPPDPTLPVSEFCRCVQVRSRSAGTGTASPSLPIKSYPRPLMPPLFLPPLPEPSLRSKSYKAQGLGMRSPPVSKEPSRTMTTGKATLPTTRPPRRRSRNTCCGSAFPAATLRR